ncbi:DNA adenine methylase [bacterium]|jgi:DNA adenine methylase Dam|nr:DNA adenine methylase [bacterium]
MFVNGYLNYTGSKYKLLEQIIPEMDYTKKYFIDLFTGSFVVGANVVDKYDKILSNDIIKELVDIHKLLLESDDIIEKTKLLCPSKENQEAFLELRDSFNKEKSPEKLWALILCSTNNLMRFNQSFKYNQTFGLRSFSENTQKKADEFAKHIRPYKDKIIFTSKHFSKIILNKPSFVYIDPPYGRIQDENGNITNKQISEAGYNCFFKKEDDIQLYEYIINLNKNKHTFMLSGLLEHDGKKSWMLNKLISDGFNYKELIFDYNKVSRKGNKESKEIIIMNY